MSGDHQSTIRLKYETLGNTIFRVAYKDHDPKHYIEHTANVPSHYTREQRIELYRERAAAGLDIFSGEKRI